MPRKKLSIIIPTTKPFATLAKIRKHNCAKATFMIIANGVFDRLPEAEEENFTILHLEHPQSPYAARNLGMKQARNGDICFLDDSCTPSENWLDAGLKALNRNGDLIAGEVRFRFRNPKKPTASELFDSVTNIQQKQSVFNGYAKTTNLFVAEHVWKEIGRFDSNFRSGEDVAWTQRAVAMGFCLRFSDEIIVYKQAREFSALFRKSLRTGAGKGGRMSFPCRLRFAIMKMVLPLNPRVMRTIVSLDLEAKISSVKLIKIYILGFFFKFMHGLGALFPSFFKHAD